MKVKLAETFSSGTARKAILDKCLLAGSAFLLIGLGIGSFMLGAEYGFSGDTIIAAWFGVSFFLMVVWSVRSKFRKRGFIIFCAGWFLVHMVVVFGAASRLPLLISILPMGLELWIGLAVIFWLFGVPSNQKK